MRDSDRTRMVSELARTLEVPKPAQVPFIGRQREQSQLQQRLNAAVAGECQLVLVGGQPGIGKTRLLDELENLAHARQIRVLHGRSLSTDRGLPYQEFFEIILEHFRVRGQGSAPPPDLSDLAPELVALFPMLSEIAEIRAAAGSGALTGQRVAQSPESRSQIFELLARTLARIAGDRPWWYASRTCTLPTFLSKRSITWFAAWDRRRYWSSGPTGRPKPTRDTRSTG